MISVASSIKFRKDDGLLPSFDNTMFADETHFRVAKHPFFQKFFSTDTVTIQAEVDTGQNMEMQYSVGTIHYPGVVVWGEFQSMTGEAKVFTGVTYDYWEIDIAMTSFTVVKFKAIILESESVVETWSSEPVEIVTNDGKYLQIEFFNLENKFHAYYTNPTEADRLSHLIRIKGRLMKYKPAGETSVYDNQDEIVKTKDEVKRILTLETELIPPYLAEMLVVAVAHDKFFVNEVEFVAEKKPDYESGSGDWAQLTCELTQRDVIGMNAHDTGYNCDGTNNADMIVLQELAASGQKSFAITDDYMILTITGERTAGSPVLTAGTTPGGTDVLSGMSLTASYLVEVALVPFDKASIPGGTLYVTVSGAGATANIYVATIKNRQ